MTEERGVDPKHRFLADPALGKLAKWLRILGMDAQYISTGTMEGAIAACEPDRILLTRSKRFAKHAITGRMVFINSNDPMDQLKEVVDVVGMQRGDLRPFSRYVRCNISVSPVEKASVKSRVPDYVWEHHHRFHQCRRCGRIYWAGTHLERSLMRIDKLFGVG